MMKRILSYKLIAGTVALVGLAGISAPAGASGAVRSNPRVPWSVMSCNALGPGVFTDYKPMEGLHFLGQGFEAKVSPPSRDPNRLQGLIIRFSGTWKNTSSQPVSFTVHGSGLAPLYSPKGHREVFPGWGDWRGDVRVDIRQDMRRQSTFPMQVTLNPGQSVRRSYTASLHGIDPAVFKIRPGYRVLLELPIAIQGLLHGGVKAILLNRMTMGRLR